MPTTTKTTTSPKIVFPETGKIIWVLRKVSTFFPSMSVLLLLLLLSCCSYLFIHAKCDIFRHTFAFFILFCLSLLDVYLSILSIYPISVWMPKKMCSDRSLQITTHTHTQSIWEFSFDDCFAKKLNKKKMDFVSCSWLLSGICLYFRQIYWGITSVLFFLLFSVFTLTSSQNPPTKNKTTRKTIFEQQLRQIHSTNKQMKNEKQLKSDVETDGNRNDDDGKKVYSTNQQNFMCVWFECKTSTLCDSTIWEEKKPIRCFGAVYSYLTGTVSHI